MKMRIAFAALFRALVPALALAFTVSPAKANDLGEALIKEAEARMASIKSVSAEIEVLIADARPGYEAHHEASAKMQFLRPNFVRIEHTEQGRTTEGATAKRKAYTTVSDGKSEWQVDLTLNEYREKAVDPDGANIEIPKNVPLRILLKAKVPHIDAPADYTGTEEWEGATYRVIEFKEADPDAPADATKPPAARQRAFIGADDLIHRYVNEQLGGKFVEEMAFRNIRIDEPMLPADFAYAPPPGLKKRVPRPSPLLANGTAAPDFTVADRNGKPVKLSDFRGKVVVLDFWASWCGPCAEALPIDNALAKKYSKSVVSLAINVQDKQELFDRWLIKNPQYDALTFAIDPAERGEDIATVLYKSPGLPTMYVIGKDGKIANGFLGFGYSSAELENAVKAAGGEMN